MGSGWGVEVEYKLVNVAAGATGFDAVDHRRGLGFVHMQQNLARSTDLNAFGQGRG